jgi:hypothetical protein
MEQENSKTPASIAAIVQYVIERAIEKDKFYCLELQLVAGPHSKTAHIAEVKSTIKAVVYPYHKHDSEPTTADIMEVNEIGRHLKRIIADLHDIEPSMDSNFISRARQPLPGFVNWEHC